MKILNFIYFKDKKANATYIFVLIIISILSFFVVINNFVHIGDNIVSKSNDLTCRAFIKFKGTTSGDLIEKLNLINLKCKKDSLKIKSDNKDIVFKKIADESRRCWERYDSGNSEFLQNFGTSGSWCFTCGEIDFSKDLAGTKYSYNDFIKWADTHYVKLGNGTKVPYSKTFNMKYTDVSNDELMSIRKDIDDIKEDNDIRDMSILFSEQYEFLQDLKAKEINSNFKTYVVYRYDKLNNSQKAFNAGVGTIIGVGTSIISSELIEGILWWGGSALVCGASTLATIGSAGTLGFTEVLCAAMAGKTLKKSKDITEKIVKKGNKIRSISKKLTEAFKETNRFRKVKEMFSFFTGKVEDIGLIAKKISSRYPKISEGLIGIQNDLNSLGIKNINDISLKILENENKLKKLHDLTDKAIDMNILNNPGIRKLAEKENIYFDELNRLKKIENDLNKMKYNDLKKAENIDKIKNYFIGIGILTGGLTGAEIGSNFNFNSNQYVDIMTEEQYYRLCGTEPNLK